MIILIVGAHPDDIEIGLGATIHRYRQDHKFHGLILTSGDLRAKPKDREKATLRAARILGYQPHFKRLPDSNFTEIEAEQAIQEKISELNPDLVISHYYQERHRDHQNVYRGNLSATRRISNVLFFEGPYSISFKPIIYVPVRQEDIEAKIRALQEHAKVLEPRKYLTEQYIKSLATIRGSKIEVDYAEAYAADRLVRVPF